MVVSLSKVAAPELGLAPMMSVQSEGIYITRWEEDCTAGLPIYSFKPRHYTQGLLEGLARHILDQSLVDDAFLIKNGFKREYGAIANMQKPVPFSPIFRTLMRQQAQALAHQAPVRQRRVRRATPIRSAVKAIALRLSKLSPRV